MKQKVVHVDSIPALKNSCLNDSEKAELQKTYNDIMFFLQDDYDQPLSCDTGVIKEFSKGYFYQVDEFNNQIEYAKVWLTDHQMNGNIDFEINKESIEELGIDCGYAQKRILSLLYYPVIEVKSNFIFSIFSDINAFFHIHHSQISSYFNGFSYHKVSGQIKNKLKSIKHEDLGQGINSRVCSEFCVNFKS